MNPARGHSTGSTSPRVSNSPCCRLNMAFVYSPRQRFGAFQLSFDECSVSLDSCCPNPADRCSRSWEVSHAVRGSNHTIRQSTFFSVAPVIVACGKRHSGLLVKEPPKPDVSVVRPGSSGKGSFRTAPRRRATKVMGPRGSIGESKDINSSAYPERYCRSSACAFFASCLIVTVTRTRTNLSTINFVLKTN